MHQRNASRATPNPGQLATLDRLLEAAQHEIERNVGGTGQGARTAAWLRLGQIRLSLEGTGSRPW